MPAYDLARRSVLCAALATIALGCSSGSKDAPAPATDAGADGAVDIDGVPLDTFIPQQLATAKIPGMTGAIIKNGKVVWTGAYGLADVDKKTPMKVDTIFLVASISKTFTACEAMRLVEQGKLKLDDDINLYLPFKVRNPKFPDVPITLRMLMTHTGGFVDDYIHIFSLIGQGDSPVTMREFLEGILFSGGKYYEPGLFGDDKPGTKYGYSQVGATLVGYVVELAGGAPFDKQGKDGIFTPLGMADTSWRLADVDITRMAIPYTYQVSKGQVPNGNWGAPFYPAATIHTTAPQLAKYLTMYIRGGAYDGGQLLKAETVAEMERVQFPALNADQGLFFQRHQVDGVTVVGHSGGAPGVSTTMYLRPTDGVGVITLTNSDLHIRVSLTRDEELAAYEAIETRLFHEAAKY